MRRRMRTLLAILLGVPALVAAQTPGSTPAAAPLDTVFLRAQRLVSEGRGATGRALVDSVLAASTEGSAPYAEALFWRASLAATAVDAERDYRRLAVEFPLSARSEDALVRLAQMELARGDRAMAVKHLERLALEHPTATARPRASYWMARILFENGDAAGACTALAGARASVPASDAELRNEVSYLSRRCAGVPIARVDTATPSLTSVAPTVVSPATAAPPTVVAATPPATPPGAPPFSVLVPAPAATTPAATAPVTMRTDSARPRPAADTIASAPRVPRPSVETQPVFVAGSSVVPSANATVTPPVTAPSGPPATMPSAPAPPVSQPVATVPAATPPSVTAPANTPAAVPARPTTDTVAARPAPAALPPARPAVRSSGRFTVQVAAYDSRAPAEKLAATLVRGGWDARVFGSDRPFRVRIGRYTTRAEAVAAAKSLAAKQIEAFVTETEP